MELTEFELWTLFGIIIGVSLSLDLGLISRIIQRSKKKLGKVNRNNENGGLSFRQSLIRSVVWVCLAGLFASVIFLTLGNHKTLEFITGYVLEESLSVDNMMLFLLIFTTLGIPHKYQHKVLSVGIVSAIVMRIFVILIGSSLLENFQWMIYVFGGILLLGAFKMILQRNEQKIDISKNMSVKILKKIVPIQTKITDNRFFTKTNGVLYATPLFVALIVIEMTDLVFAMDSIPAVLAVTTDPFIVITSNIFAISGLRALYFLISNVVHKFYYLKIGLIILLFFIGIKMIISEIYEISTFVSFLIIVLILGLVIAASMARSYKKPKNI
jgi:tellurite resistance protein TerC